MTTEPFEPARHLIQLKGKDYLEVADRRCLPMSAEHKEKIRQAVTVYANLPTSRQKNQPTGPDAARFKTGTSPKYYRRVAFSAHGRLCNRCGGERPWMVVHHSNGDRRDNRLENLEVLCQSCHLKHHRARVAA